MTRNSRLTTQFFLLMILLAGIPALAGLYSPVKAGPNSTKFTTHNSFFITHQPLTVKVKRVLSADTFEIVGDSRLTTHDSQLKVRYIGLSAPAPGQTGYSQALSFHRKLVGKKLVNIMFDEKPVDENGTLLGFVFINKMTFVNAELIRYGYVRANPKPPNLKYAILFKNLEQRARSRNLGIWQK